MVSNLIYGMATSSIDELEEEQTGEVYSGQDSGGKMINGSHTLFTGELKSRSGNQSVTGRNNDFPRFPSLPYRPQCSSSKATTTTNPIFLPTQHSPIYSMSFAQHLLPINISDSPARALSITLAHNTAVQYHGGHPLVQFQNFPPSYM